jgi:hypothetical protein
LNQKNRSLRIGLLFLPDVINLLEAEIIYCICQFLKDTLKSYGGYFPQFFLRVLSRCRKSEKTLKCNDEEMPQKLSHEPEDTIFAI